MKIAPAGVEDDAGGTPAVEGDTARIGVGNDAEIRPASRSLEIGASGADARRDKTTTGVDAMVAGTELRTSVKIRIRCDADAVKRIAIDFAKRMLATSLRQRQRAIDTVGFAALFMILQSDEIGEDIIPSPLPAAYVAPAIIVFWLPADGNQAVAGARPAEDLPARPRKTPVHHVWLGLSRQTPVKAGIADDAEIARRSWHQIDVTGPGFEKEHMAFRIGR